MTLLGANLTRDTILGWLREEDPDRLEELWQEADSVRSRHVGPEVHLRGLVEISSHCCRSCTYCGLRAPNGKPARYRMDADEIVAAAHEAQEFGYGTVVLQAGEDDALTGHWVSGVVRRIKQETGLAVTLSLGERPLHELLSWRAAGADRYLLRFETSDADLYERIHPPRTGRLPVDRTELLRDMRKMGYEIGSGVMVGLPGQTYESLLSDLEWFRRLDLDMIGIGPFIAHPDTPLGQVSWAAATEQQVPATEQMVYKMVALARLLCPDANIPSTTALATLNRQDGRERGLSRGANVVMPNLTPAAYRARYEIYPAKACIGETGSACHACMGMRIRALGRVPGLGAGGRRRSRGLSPARCMPAAV